MINGDTENTGVNQTTESQAVEQTGGENESTDTTQVVKTESSSKTPDVIPYARFKEVNDELRNYKQAYEPLEEILDKSPEFKEHFEGIVNDYYAGKLTKKQAEAEVKKLESSEKVVKQEVVKDERFDSYLAEVRQENRSSYNEQFLQLAEEKMGLKFENGDEDKKQLQFLANMLTNRIFEINPKAYNSYNPKLLNRAFDEIYGNFERISEKKMARLSSAKANNSTPASGSGSPSFNTPKIETAEDRARYLQEAFAESKKL